MTHAPRLSELVDLNELAVHVADGLVAARPHPHLHLQILCYTRRAQYEFAWPPAVRACRGLIVRPDHDDLRDVGDGDVVARPWAKFFTDEQIDALRERHPDDPEFAPLGAPAAVYEKLDGSLGIAYPTPDGHRIATKGSFTSDQAAFANRLLAERYADVQFPTGVTVLFEIIGQRNVVDYGDFTDLVLIGMVDDATGKDLAPEDAAFWPGPVVTRHTDLEHCSPAELVARDERNREGFVVVLDDGRRVKVKFERYKQLHRLVTGTTELGIWRALSAGQSVEELVEDTPDEFDEWVRDVAQRLTRRYQEAEDAVRAFALSVLRQQVDESTAAAVLARADLRRGEVMRHNDQREQARRDLEELLVGSFNRSFERRYRELTDVPDPDDPRVARRRAALAELLVDPDRLDEAIARYQRHQQLDAQDPAEGLPDTLAGTGVQRQLVAQHAAEAAAAQHNDGVPTKLVFEVLNGQDLRPAIWKLIRPADTLVDDVDE